MPAKRPNILLIAIDSLRADHMSCYGYDQLTTPRIDAFARESVTSNSSFSQVSPTGFTNGVPEASFSGFLPSAIFQTHFP